MCAFSGGEAHFMASGIDSCGMKYQGAPQEYGAWFARLKGDVEPSGQLFTDIFLLWPANNQWPPEIGVYEDLGNRSLIFTAPASQVKPPAKQPALAMNMALQSENLQGTTGASSPRETMTVDWVERFSWNG